MKKTKVEKTVVELNKEVTTIQDNIPSMPWHVWTTFSYETEPIIEIQGDTVCLGGDYKTVEEVKYSLTWLIEQFGGIVKWKD